MLFFGIVQRSGNIFIGMKINGCIQVRWIYGLLLALLPFALKAQSPRISDHNTIGWLAFNGTIHLDPNWSIHTEYQFRRDEFLSEWQQSLFKAGINYTINPALTLRLGYALAETFDYGDIPINVYGKQFTEHRLFQMVSLSDNVGITGLNHRFMLEQRWVGRYSAPELDKEDGFNYVNRFRYMFRAQLPLKGTRIQDKTPYAAVYDEILIGFGKNVNQNVFDQNRLGLLLGYQFSGLLRVEGGFLSQIAQLPRRVNDKQVFQYNNGLILSATFNFNRNR